MANIDVLDLNGKKVGTLELAQEVFVKPALRIDPRMLVPDIVFVGCAAAYRSNYDSEKCDALSSLIRFRRQRQSRRVGHIQNRHFVPA